MASLVSLYGAALSLLLLGIVVGSALANRTRRVNLIVGSIAHVAVRIPDHGVGLIALVVGSRRTTLPARSSDGRAIGRSTEVAVVDMRGRVAIVCALD